MNIPATCSLRVSVGTAVIAANKLGWQISIYKYGDQNKISACNTTPKNAKNAATEREVQLWLELIVPMLADRFIAEQLTKQEK